MISKKLMISIVVVMLIFLAVGAEASTVLTYEDLGFIPPMGWYGPIGGPPPYDGVTGGPGWGIATYAWYAAPYNGISPFSGTLPTLPNGLGNTSFTPPPQDPLVSIPQTNFFYNYNGTLQATVSTTPINFVSAYFWAFNINNAKDSNLSATTLTINGYLGGPSGTLRGTQTITLTDQPTLVTLNINDIDYGTFTRNGTSGNQFMWGLDNVKISTVPIPVAFWLLGSGLAGLVGIRRRFKN